ncbi:hypothetical protein SAMN05421813_106133 [Daejeonella rubra]|uniref:ERF1 domain-containing protein 3 n=1 Tax=Daejeonella rubra TaxID=990371 RepID=A0A1G9QP97_9SPHI|nr:hypothetical protein [Daejeonella rubra]SDM12671.1 hypothetical protein SAMN05421813_106133 [Daejeonella rubra]
MNQFNNAISDDLIEVMHASPYRPSVTIILPFEPLHSLISELEYSLKIASGKIKDELNENYPAGIVLPMLQKLDRIIAELDFKSQKKSVAIYLSPVFEKVIYLDIKADERIMVDSTFEIRDLVYSNKHLHKYLLLILSGKESRLYLGNSKSFEKLASPGSVYVYVNDAPEKILNFSDMSERRQIIRDKFLQHTDNLLDKVLKEHQIPLFVMGTEKLLGHFKKHTKHSDTVFKYITGNYEDHTLPQLKAIMKPYIASWFRAKQKAALVQLERAADKKKLVFGIKNVWNAVNNFHGRLLVVERNFMVAARFTEKNNTIELAEKPYTKRPDTMDLVDDVIEKVLENGGDVEFVDKNLLKDYNQIALVKYY